MKPRRTQLQGRARWRRYRGRFRHGAAAALWGASILGWTLGCGGSGGAQGPPEILYGRDTCRQCVMIVNDARYAAGYTDEDGMPVAFDDIGCMVQFMRDNEDLPYVMWVSVYNTGSWVRAGGAWFVHSDDVVTPMGSGIIAVSDEATAQELATKLSGTVLRLGELMAGKATAKT